jgi:preprotein translocase subunit SecA
LVKHLEGWGVPVPDDLFPDHLNQLRRQPFTEALVERALAAYAAKEEAVVKVAAEHHSPQPGAFYMRQFERMVTLQVVDTLWMAHIDDMDEMRSGISLRATAQKDPLVEFKREAYGAFEDFKTSLQAHIVEHLFKAPVTIEVAQPAEQALPRNLRTNADQISSQPKSAGELPNGRAAVPPRNPKLSAAVDRLSQPTGDAPRSSSGAGQVPGGPRPADAQINGGGHGTPGGASGTLSSGGVAPGASAARPASASQPAQPRPAGSGKHQAPAHGAKGSAGKPGGQRPVAAVRTSPQPASSGAGAKLGRNDPCYCGSGRKYKLCHGR